MNNHPIGKTRLCESNIPEFASPGNARTGRDFVRQCQWLECLFERSVRLCQGRPFRYKPSRRKGNRRAYCTFKKGLSLLCHKQFCGDLHKALTEQHKAIALITSAATQGYADAQCALGNLYATFLGDDSAAMWLTKAAAQGHKAARLVLNHIGRHDASDAIDAGGEKPIVLAKLSRLGSIPALIALGEEYFGAWDFPEFAAHAWSYLLPAAWQGSQKAQRMCEELEAHGIPREEPVYSIYFDPGTLIPRLSVRTVGPDSIVECIGAHMADLTDNEPHNMKLDRTIEDILHAKPKVLRRFPSPQQRISSKYLALFCKALPKLNLGNYPGLVPLIREAAESGCIDAQYVLGALLLSRFGNDAADDADEGRSWLHQAADKGQRVALMCIAKDLEDSDPQQAFAIVREIVEADKTAAPFLARLYAKGIGVEKDVDKARGLLSLSKPLDNYMRAQIYQNERKADPNGDEIALTLMAQAAEAGVPDAIADIAGRLDRDDSRRWLLMHKAAAFGTVKAQLELGRWLRTAPESLRDLAPLYLLAAAKQGAEISADEQQYLNAQTDIPLDRLRIIFMVFNPMPSIGVLPPERLLLALRIPRS